MSKEKGKGSGGAPDELEETKAKLLAKELELITERNNMRRIQERSHLIETHIDHLATASKDKIQKLEDIITFLNGWVKKLASRFCFVPSLNICCVAQSYCLVPWVRSFLVGPK